MPYNANLIPIDAQQTRDVILPWIAGDKAVSDPFEKLRAEAIRIRQVQRRTQAWKQRLLHWERTSKSLHRPLETQAGDSRFSKASRRPGAAQGIESPPVFSIAGIQELPTRVPHDQPNSLREPWRAISQESRVATSRSSHAEAICPERKTENVHQACRSVLSRPFFIAEQIADTYDKYRLARPHQVDRIVNHVICSSPTLDSWNRLESDSQGVEVMLDHTPIPEAVTHQEVTWKMNLLRKAYLCLGRLRAVFDGDGEPFHPHQILSEESPMILAEFASFLHPGWSVEGPWNPSNLLPQDGLDGRGLFESPQLLWGELTKVAPALGEMLSCRTNKPYSVGAYIPPPHVGRLGLALQRLHEDLQRSGGQLTNHDSQNLHALAMWIEATTYAQRHGLGLLETADLYNLHEGVLN